MASDFDLEDFLPYRLNQAAEACSRGFARIYAERYGMIRGEWRVLFHLGHFGTLSAHEIAQRAMTDKTKISRAVHKLAAKGFLERHPDPADRRRERLALTTAGRAAFADLTAKAAAYDAELARGMTARERADLLTLLRRLAR